jgi:ribonuclease VapC
LILFVDASALVAMIEHESDGAALFDRVDQGSAVLWSALSCWEAVSALQNSYKRPIALARQRVTDFAEQFRFDLVAIGTDELAIALDAYQTYGRGRHRARLNFGDCFAYACAKTNGATLLYKGDDFAHTDLA